MNFQILGISASPFEKGNVERMIKYLCETSECKYEMIRLSKLNISPCQGCAHLCSKDNMCKIDDDFKDVLLKILNTDLLVLGGPSYFNGLNSYMFMLLERLWCMRHQRYPLEGKPFIVIATGGIQEPKGVVSGIKTRMEAYHASFVGEITFQSGNLPCFMCGFGKKCKVGSIRKFYPLEQIKDIKITKLPIHKWEDSPSTKKQMQNAVIKLKEFIN